MLTYKSLTSLKLFRPEYSKIYNANKGSQLTNKNLMTTKGLKFTYFYYWYLTSLIGNPGENNLLILEVFYLIHQTNLNNCYCSRYSPSNWNHVQNPFIKLNMKEKIKVTTYKDTTFETNWEVLKFWKGLENFFLLSLLYNDVSILTFGKNYTDCKRC